MTIALFNLSLFIINRNLFTFFPPYKVKDLFLNFYSFHFIDEDFFGDFSHFLINALLRS